MNVEFLCGIYNVFACNLEQPKKLLFWFHVTVLLHVFDIGSLVVAAKFRGGTRDAFRRSLTSFASGPVQTLSVSKNTDGLRLQETASFVFLIPGSPLLLLGTSDIGVIPALKYE